jgi:hypothetical protein
MRNSLWGTNGKSGGPKLRVHDIAKERTAPLNTAAPDACLEWDIESSRASSYVLNGRPIVRLDSWDYGPPAWLLAELSDVA